MFCSRAREARRRLWGSMVVCRFGSAPAHAIPTRFLLFVPDAVGLSVKGIWSPTHVRRSVQLRPATNVKLIDARRRPWLEPTDHTSRPSGERGPTASRVFRGYDNGEKGGSGGGREEYGTSQSTASRITSRRFRCASAEEYSRVPGDVREVRACSLSESHLFRIAGCLTSDSARPNPRRFYTSLPYAPPPISPSPSHPPSQRTKTQRCIFKKAYLAHTLTAIPTESLKSQSPTKRWSQPWLY